MARLLHLQRASSNYGTALSPFISQKNCLVYPTLKTIRTKQLHFFPKHLRMQKALIIAAT